jgi:deoxycytidylate deaminase
MIINASLNDIVAAKDYPDDLAKTLLEESSVNVRQFEVKPTEDVKR